MFIRYSCSNWLSTAPNSFCHYPSNLSPKLLECSLLCQTEEDPREEEAAKGKDGVGNSRPFSCSGTHR